MKSYNDMTKKELVAELKKQHTAKDLFVRRAYTKNGITVVVEMDFVKKTVSLVEKDGANKKWVFAERTPEYMNGWRAILIAMEYAVQQAQAEFAALADKDHEFLLEVYMALDKALPKGGKF